MTRAQLAKFAPQLKWPRFLGASGLGSVDTVIVGETTAVQAEARMIDSVPLRRGRTGSPFTSSAITLHIFRRRSTTPTSISTPRRCATSRPSANAGSAGCRWSIRRSARASARSTSRAIIRPKATGRWASWMTSRSARASGKIDGSGWMDAATRPRRWPSSPSFDPRTGHPEQIHRLFVARGESAATCSATSCEPSEFDWTLQLSPRCARPVDRDLWLMTPQTNNAYYDPSMNQITFPAAILQPPYFDPDADPAANYGSIGAASATRWATASTIRGGSSTPPASSATGGPRRPSGSWRSAATLIWQVRLPRARAGRAINGELTLGENLGDLGRLEIAYAAYRHLARRQARRR